MDAPTQNTNGTAATEPSSSQLAGSLSMGNVVEAGDIHTINDPEDMETVCPVNKALVIQFESAEAIRKAMSDGKCGFTLFEANTEVERSQPTDNEQHDGVNRDCSH